MLDADGVETHVGDTVYDATGEEHIVKEVYFDDDESHEHTVWCGEFKSGIAVVYIADQLTHTRPDSWERLEDDATMSPWSYCDKHRIAVDSSDGEIATTTEAFAFDLICRAKALAEKEAAR